MREMRNAVPTPPLILTVVFLTVRIALPGEITFARQVGPKRQASYNEFTNRDAEGLATLTHLLGDTYAVLLPFTTFVIWEQFTEVENCVIRQCNSFDELLRFTFSRYLNANDAANIRRAVRAYRGRSSIMSATLRRS
jgi:hypothetical protein